MATTIYLVVSQTFEGDIPEAAFTDAGIAATYTTRFADMGSAVYAIKEIPLNPVFTSSADESMFWLELSPKGDILDDWACPSHEDHVLQGSTHVVFEDTSTGMYVIAKDHDQAREIARVKIREMQLAGEWKPLYTSEDVAEHRGA